MRNFGAVFCVILFVLVVTASGHVILTGKNITISFDDIEANFGPSVRGTGISGMLYLAEPLDACSPLANKVDMRRNGSSSPFALIIRGGCSFEDKVRRAQLAGYKAAIVYDNVYGDLVASNLPTYLSSKKQISYLNMMCETCVKCIPCPRSLGSVAGISDGIDIAAVFVSKSSGETLAQYAGIHGIVVCIIPSFENSACSIMAVSFISLLAMSAMLATCFFVRRHRIRRSRHGSRVRESHGMSSRLVKAMPSLTFTTVMEGNSTSRTCAICLEDYNFGEKLRILPCRHEFHAVCVDAWLTSWRTFCPVCKRDVRTTTSDPPASESTPLLASVTSSLSALSSFRSSSSLATSSAILISAGSSHSPLVSSGRYNHQQSLRSFNRSPHLTGSRSSIDLRNASSQRSHASYLTSSPNNTLRYPVISPLNLSHVYPFIFGSGNASSGFIGSTSSQQQPRPLHYSESTTSFSTFASAQSLPEC